MKTYKNIVIGGGITGLSFANFAKDCMVLEKEREVGGYCRTIYREPYIWDYAGHFFHFKEKESKKYFENVFLGLGLISKNKNTKIFYKGRLVDYPFQSNIQQLEKEEFIECLCDLYQAEQFRDRNQNDYSSFEKMLYEKFGKGICSKFLIPYNEKLYACDLQKLDTDAMGRFFPYVNFHDVMNHISGKHVTSYNDTFIYPRLGAATFINYLSEKIPKERIRINCEVREIDVRKHLVYTDDVAYEYENLINTAPLNRFIKILGKKDEEAFSYNKVLVFNMGFDKPSVNKALDWIYIPDKKINFYRVGFYNNILGMEELSIYVEIGYGKEDKIDVEQAKKDTLMNLRMMGIIKEHILVDYEPVLMSPAYVHISPKSNALKEEICKELKEKNIYSIGRYGGWTYCSMEDCFLEAYALAKELNTK